MRGGAMKPKAVRAKSVIWREKNHDVDALSRASAKKLEAAFKTYQSTRQRDAVYDYLTAVYAFALGFKRGHHCKAVGARMLSLKGLGTRKTDLGRFRSILRATADANENTRWKWVQCLEFARDQDVAAPKLKSFILEDQGGINACADEWGQIQLE